MFQDILNINIPQNKKQVVVVANDLHIPFEDPRIINLFFEFLKDIQPDIIVLNGDIMDCYELSDFSKSAWLDISFEKECKRTEEFLCKLRTTCVQAQIIYIFGNHEDRLQKYINKNASELAFLSHLKLENILGLDDYQIDAIPTREELTKFSDNFIQINDLYIGHWDKVSKHSSYTAKSLIDDKGVSLIQGHTHRGGVYYKTLVDGKVLIGVENFCMCLTQPTYINNTNWQNGWSVITFFQGFYIEPINIKSNFIYNGKIYK